MAVMVMEQYAEVGPVPFMVCAECARPAPWNPTTFCGWACYDARPRDPESAPLVLTFFLGLGPSTLTRHNPNP
ncbi:hypothetical protein OG689_40930 [Kitasatospora sp. NBC_00240]|uniref:hypothetical protein n=1 Tax=Kitasatospora sp. NBC_00240 TaxID=2903567 RepID=UPI002257EBBD|nr:hypothetical protein [Kitasatospora sp. NBC_00240]MCX5215532.1 hypothetical protein [Kitasatospora sp. NBC_00240]